MSAVAELLDKYKKARSIPTDMALAENLGKTRALVSAWRAGKAQPQLLEVEKMCQATGEDEGLWLTLLAAERAETPAARTSLLRMVDLAKRYGHAACLALALGVVPHSAKAAEHLQQLATSHEVAPVYIMRNQGSTSRSGLVVPPGHFPLQLNLLIAFLIRSNTVDLVQD
jgi:transcriptional regulator with XRE-family HTH domain